MTFPIEKKLVIAVSSSALFDLSESHAIFMEEGAQSYQRYQEERLDDVLDKGVAFPFIRRFLRLNELFPQEQPVEVVLLSRNSAVTGRRVFRSIAHYGLNISRAAFMEGKSPHAYIPAFNAALFLSANALDVQQAIEAGYPAGTVLPSKINDDDSDHELRIAFDFDGVIVDDEAESVYKAGDLDDFVQHEKEKYNVPLKAGPLGRLYRNLSELQALESAAMQSNSSYQRVIRTSIVTARSAPSHERVITTLESWGVTTNETFFLGGMSKKRILSILKPHIFFDDQMAHLTSGSGEIPMVHVPFGVANQPSQDAADNEDYVRLSSYRQKKK